MGNSMGESCEEYPRSKGDGGVGGINRGGDAKNKQRILMMCLVFHQNSHFLSLLLLK